MNIIRLTEPNTPLNDADHVGSFNFLGRKYMGELKQILKSDLHWNLYVNKIEELVDKYEKVDVKTMGFPDNWKELLELKNEK